MLSSKDLQNAYVKLYKALREYIWEYRTVECIANLEIAVHTTFPDLTEIRKLFNSLNLDVRDAANGDEDLEAALTRFKELIEKDETLFAKLEKVSEVSQ